VFHFDFSPNRDVQYFVQNRKDQHNLKRKEEKWHSMTTTAQIAIKHVSNPNEWMTATM
jgi:hypothetical protein